MDDAKLLALVKHERTNSIGFDNDEELRNDRERALRFAKGDLSKDIPALQGRSSVSSSDVADAVETALPDLVEIFTSEDAVAFSPKGEEDEDAAQQETDYINHVFFNENPGFMILYAAIKDALLVKTGVFKWRAEDCEEVDRFEGKSPEELVAAMLQHGEAVELEDSEVDPEDPETTYSFTIRRKWRKPVVEAVAPEDFTVSRDTVELRKTPYCAHKSRVRLDDLVDLGVSEETAQTLPSYGDDDSEIDQARDTAGEHNNSTGDTGVNRLVEVVEHYIRVKGQYWRVLTDAQDSKVLDKEKVTGIRFAAITPYPVAHRFYGMSLADKLIEIAKIKTSLMRMLLDSGHFALNQRNYVDMTKVNEWTISDLLNNAPNVPVRGNGPQAVTPLGSGGLNFDAFGALEYFSVQGEARSGIVRNAQGLNPDTLHDTAKGALALMTEAQKRVRMIARIFAETGIKDMFLGLHALIRETAQDPVKVRLRNKWVEIDPTSWGSRLDMTIEIGAGAGGQEAELQRLIGLMEVIDRLVEKQGGVNGPFVDAKNVYNAVVKYLERGLRLKSADPYITDPEEAPPQEPQPDPAVMEVEAKAEEMRMKFAMQQAEAEQKAALESEKAAAALQLQSEKAAADVRLAETRAAADIELARERNALELEQKREAHALDLQLKREVADVELQLKSREMELEAELKAQANALNAAVSAQTNIVGPELGGDPG